MSSLDLGWQVVNKHFKCPYPIQFQTAIYNETVWKKQYEDQIHSELDPGPKSEIYHSNVMGGVPIGGHDDTSPEERILRTVWFDAIQGQLTADQKNEQGGGSIERFDPERLSNFSLLNIWKDRQEGFNEF